MVVIGDVHRHFDVDQRACAHLKKHQQRVAQAGATAVRPGGDYRDRRDLIVKRPARHVDVMHGGVDDGHSLV